MNSKKCVHNTAYSVHPPYIASHSLLFSLKKSYFTSIVKVRFTKVSVQDLLCDVMYRVNVYALVDGENNEVKMLHFEKIIFFSSGYFYIDMKN